MTRIVDVRAQQLLLPPEMIRELRARALMPRAQFRVV